MAQSDHNGRGCRKLPLYRSLWTGLHRLFLKRAAILCVASLLAFGALQSHCFAGGGPENVALVVNPRSWASMTIANHFMQLRAIPPSNVIYIDWAGKPTSTGIDNFRTTILLPILEQIEQRGLSSQIDYIVYSSDFPFAINLADDFEGETPPYSVGSITGLTFLFPFTLSQDTRYMAGRSNLYAPEFLPRRVASTSRAFRFQYAWPPEDEREEGTEGLHYILSTMLAYTSGRGNSVGEAINYLSRSALADGTHPQGTIFFMRNSDVRSTTREAAFGPVMQELLASGIDAEIANGILPTDQEQVLGAVVGKATYNWGSSRSSIVPGAICENLTSYGGILSEGAGQTPLTEFLRYGAAGSSGTVVEPYAIQAKFPHPAIHVHYARGCSLAESFYQSVTGPYQLLIVGDPLCRPFAHIPDLSVEGLTGGDNIEGNLEFRVRSPSEDSQPIDHYEIFLDGKKLLHGQESPEYQIDTTEIPDGYHELRVVAIDASPIESQGRRIIPFHLRNRGRFIEVAADPAYTRLDQRLRLSANSPGSSEIIFLHNLRVVGRIEGEQGETSIPLNLFGMGPITIQAVGLDNAHPENLVIAEPIQIEVQPPLIHSGCTPPRDLTEGLLLSKTGQRGEVVSSTTSQNWLATAGITAEDIFQLSGYFENASDDVYQLNILLEGQMRVMIDGELLHAAQDAPYESVYLPMTLGRGWHRLEIEGKTPNPGRCSISFGGQGLKAIGAPHFSCRPPG